jgi:hypothetical protein
MDIGDIKFCRILKRGHEAVEGGVLARGSGARGTTTVVALLTTAPPH